MIFSLLFSLLKCSCEETDDINGLIDKSCSPESCAKRQLDSSEKNNGVYKCCYINMVDEDGIEKHCYGISKADYDNIDNAIEDEKKHYTEFSLECYGDSEIEKLVEAEQ